MHAAVVRRSCEVQGCRPRPRTRVGPTACEREESPAENQWIFYPSEASSSAMGGQGDVFGGRWKDAATPRLWPLHATTAEFAQQVATTGRQTGKQGITTGLCRLRKPLAILTWGCQCGRGCHSQGGKINLPLVLSIPAHNQVPKQGWEAAGSCQLQGRQASGLVHVFNTPSRRPSRCPSPTSQRCAHVEFLKL